MPERLKTYSFCVLLAAVLSCAAPVMRDGGEGPGTVSWELRDGKIVRLGKCIVGEMGTAGTVRFLPRNGNEMYYLAGVGDEAVPRRAGFRDISGAASYDMELPPDGARKTVRRFAGASGAAYVLLCPGAKGGGCRLYRAEFNTGKATFIKGVRDFALLESKPVILREKKGGFEIFFNGVSLPLILEGDPRFGEVLEGRLIPVTDGGSTELVDLADMRSIHAWSGGAALAVPGEHNLAIEVLDEGGTPTEKMLYYKVYIDGKNLGRTTTGPAQQTRRCNVKVDENEYHILRLERWELNVGRQTYERVNNIGQPAPLRIYMPQNRFLKLLVVREKGKYRSFVTHAVDGDN